MKLIECLPTLGEVDTLLNGMQNFRVVKLQLAILDFVTMTGLHG